MYVPAYQEDLLIIELEVGQALDLAFWVMERERRGELPVGEVAWQRFVLIALEFWFVKSGQVVSGDVDGGLVRSRLAKRVFCSRDE